MKRLNNKGITTIEVLICFVLIVIITSSMYSTVSSYNEKRMIEGYKEQIYTYKNLVSKELQDDFIKIGLNHARYKKEADGNKTVYRVECDLKDGTSRVLEVKQQLAFSTVHIGGSEFLDDDFMISYGPPDDMIDYPIPDLGHSTNSSKHKVMDLSINNVLINIKNDSVLSIYIGFYHPDLTTRYGISIVAPIDYVASSTDGGKNWTY